MFNSNLCENNIPGWFHSKDLYDLAIKISQGTSVFVELGSFYGKSTVYMARLIKKSRKPIKFYAIDTWLWDTWMDDELNINGFSSEEKKEYYHVSKLYDKDMISIVNHYLNKYKIKNYVNLIQSDSVQASKHFEDSSVDFIYLDTGHTYSRIRNELIAWIPKIRYGGLIGGDDFDRDDDNDGGVRRAVAEFSGNNFITDGVTWYFYKS